MQEIFAEVLQDPADMTTYSWRRLLPTVTQLLRLSPQEQLALGDWACAWCRVRWRRYTNEVGGAFGRTRPIPYTAEESMLSSGEWYDTTYSACVFAGAAAQCGGDLVVAAPVLPTLPCA